MELVANHDPVIHRRVTDGHRNATYTSANIRNELLKVMGSIVRNQICADVKKAALCSILADETKDCSKCEQMAIVLRFVDVETGTIFEHFLTYVEVVSLDAQGLSTYILDTRRHFGLDPTCIVSQGYDGASVMSGKCSGVQQRIRPGGSKFCLVRPYYTVIIYSTYIYRKCSPSIQIWTAFHACNCVYPIVFRLFIVNLQMDVIQINSQLNGNKL